MGAVGNGGGEHVVIGFAMVGGMFTFALAFFLIPIIRKAMNEDQRGTGAKVSDGEQPPR